MFSVGLKVIAIISYVADNSGLRVKAELLPWPSEMYSGVERLVLVILLVDHFSYCKPC